MPGLTIGIIVGVLVLLILYVISVYNKLVQMRLRVDNQWSQVLVKEEI